MPSIEILAAFFVATAIFAYMPGPALVYAAAQTIARGRGAGFRAALGLHVGGYAHVAAAALGLAVLFDAVPWLYAALKFAGAAYLIWLGVSFVLSPPKDDAAAFRVDAKTPRRAFWESVTVEVLNPKTALFFVAFLPQFTDPTAAFPIWLQLFVLGAAVNVMFSSADVLCVLLADKALAAFRASRAVGRAARAFGGSVLIALGVNIALSER